MAARPPEAARVRRELLVACMTCPLCKKLLRHATTISECLHTFCRKCIVEKLTDEEEDCCPICKIDLGCVPIEKLRPDNNLHDLRIKIFPSKRRKVNAPEVSPSLALPARRKERTLSSLAVNPPRATAQTGSTGRRTRILTRRASALRGQGHGTDEPSKKDGNNVQDRAENSSSTETLTKMTHRRRQNSSSIGPSDHMANKDLENGDNSLTNKSELWKPLNCLVEAANRTRALKLGSTSSGIKPEPVNGPDSEVHMHTSRGRAQKNKLKIQDDENCSTPIVPETKRRRKGKILKTSPQALIDAAATTRDSRSCPIWLSLVPSLSQQRDSKAPQPSSSYLRIKDGTIPVSFIHKYLAKKLSLSNEAEVTIECRGQPLNPNLLLRNLADIWLQHIPPQRYHTSIGSSGNDFVMVLNYSFKAPIP